MRAGKWIGLTLVLAGCAAAGPRDQGSAAPPESGVLEGVVVDDLGTPLPGVGVDVLGLPTRSEFGDTFQILGQTESGEDGRFALTGIPVGPCLVSAEAPDNARLQRSRVTVPSTNIELICPRWGRVAFRLIPPSGEMAPEWVDLGVCFDGRSRHGGWRGYGTEGAFEEGDFSPGAFDLTISAPGWAPVVVHFVAQAGRTVDVGKITLDRGNTVKGRVVDDEGVPLSHAYVSPQGHETSVRTDSAGRFSIDHVRRGLTRFTVSAEGYVARGFPVQVPTAGGELCLALRRGGVIRVSIRTKDGGLPYSCFIRVVDLAVPEPRGGYIEGQVSLGGVFDLSLAAGRYRIDHLRGAGGPVVSSQQVILEVAAVRSVEFVEDWD